MSRISLKALVGGCVLCLVGGVAYAAMDKTEPDSSMEKKSAPKATAEPAAATGPMMGISGEVVLKDQDAKKSGVVFLRIKDSEERVWLVKVDPSTAVTQNGLSISSETLQEGLLVDASFPRGGEGIPVAASLSVR